MEHPTLVSVDEATEVKPSEFQLQGNIFTLGRSENCHIVVRRDDVSRLHARIEREGERFLIIDADSVNGTFVNGRPVLRPQPLKHRDMIGLGAPLPMLRFIDPNPTIERPQQARLEYNAERLSFMLNKVEVKLTPNETRLLRHLFERQGQLCSFEQCAIAVWGDDYEPGRDTRLDGVIRDVRNKLRAIDPAAAERIKTHRGKGYEWVG
jgi:hypothetical protein